MEPRASTSSSSSSFFLLSIFQKSSSCSSPSSSKILFFFSAYLSSPPAPPLPPPTSGASGRDTGVTSLRPQRAQADLIRPAGRLRGCRSVDRKWASASWQGPSHLPTRLVCTRCRLGRRCRSLWPRSTARGGGRAVPARLRGESAAQIHTTVSGKKPDDSDL